MGGNFAQNAALIAANAIRTFTSKSGINPEFNCSLNMINEFESLPLKVAILTEEVKAMKVLLLEMKNMSVDGEKVIGMDEVCKLTGYKKNTIYQYVNQDKIPYHKPEHGGRKLIFFRAEIEEWLKGRKPETSEEFCERKELELYNSTNGGLN